MAKFNLKLYNYEKPGKGVERDEPKGSQIQQVFTLFFRRFGKMVLLNIIYFACFLPLLCTLFVMICNNTPEIYAALGTQEAIQSYPWAAALALLVNSFTHGFLGYIGPVLAIASAVAFGPLTAGYTFCMRNSARDEHMWISDMFTYAWRNKKQGLVVGIADIVVVIGVFTYVTSDISKTIPLSPMLLSFFAYGAIILGILYYVVRYYMYIIMVTFDMHLIEILKNALVFLVVKFQRSFVVLGVTFVVFYINAILPLPSMFLLPLFDISFVSFISVFTLYPAVDQFMVQPALKEKYAKEQQQKQD